MIKAEADLPLPSTLEVKNERSCNSATSYISSSHIEGKEKVKVMTVH